MLERVRGVPGQVFDPEGYLADFWPYFQRISDVFWKLERIQDFQEPDDPSWVAMSVGEWDHALEILDGRRADLRDYQKRTEGFARRRVRIVGHPVTPYLQWEMHALRLRAGAGEQIRVVPAEAVGYLESGQPLPELVVLGGQVLYEVLYDETATLSGARRIDEPGVIAGCRQELSELFDKGEDVLAYFDREIAPLKPPRAG